jgi:hypothetical protein
VVGETLTEPWLRFARNRNGSDRVLAMTGKPGSVLRDLLYIHESVMENRDGYSQDPD